MRRILWVALLFAVPLLLGLAASQVLRDTSEPKLFVEVPPKAYAGSSLDVLITSNEPVTYTVTYGELRLVEVAQDLAVSLLVEPGDEQLVITAEDAAGNTTTVEHRIEGVRLAAPRLVVPDRVAAGTPMTVQLTWEPSDAEVTSVGMRADDRTVPLVRDGAKALGFVAAPLTTDAATITVRAWLVDASGARRTLDAEIAVDGDPAPVEQLNIPATTLSVITPEGRVLEREALARAYAATVPALRWSEPFVLPVEGIVTSAYGQPRRYAPGGPVSFHTGTDLRAPTGTPIRATNAGVVQVADFYPIKGGLVAIDHGGGVTSLYFHQSKIFVQVGDIVARGDVIGESGATGLVSGPHLHWEMQVLGRPSDPLAWVDRLVPGQPVAETP